VFSKPPATGIGAAPGDGRELSPEEEQAILEGVERVEAEKRRALLEPGPSWREWFLYDGAKWWLGLVFLIVDVWVVGSWIYGGSFAAPRLVEALLSLAVALYLEVLLYLYLWRRPSDTALSRHRPFRRSWRALREFGRWTPEAARIRAGHPPVVGPDGTVHPDEFL